MKVLLFWWLQSQVFYQELHNQAIAFADLNNLVKDASWADIGCGLGLMSRLVDEKSFTISSFDLDYNMIKAARFLHKNSPTKKFEQKDVMELEEQFDVISATSLLSVVDDKMMVLNKMLSLLKTKEATLILIEPTSKMSVKNVCKLIVDFKTLKKYIMLLVWAKAREGKSLDSDIFNDIANIRHHTFLNDMVRVSVINTIA